MGHDHANALVEGTPEQQRITQRLVLLGLHRLLHEIYDYNPLLFDFVLKRPLRAPQTGERFAAEVFYGRAW